MDVSRHQDPFAPETVDAIDPVAELAVMLHGPGPDALAELTALPKAELQKLASDAGLPVSGTKEELAARIQAAKSDPSSETEETSPMDFPTQRFQEAGATPEELQKLEAAFAALPENIQAQRLEYYAGLASYDLTQVLEAARAQEGVDGTLEGPVGEPAGEGEQDGAEGQPETVLGVTEPPADGQVEAPAEDVPGQPAVGPDAPADTGAPAAPEQTPATPEAEPPAPPQ